MARCLLTTHGLTCVEKSAGLLKVRCDLMAHFTPVLIMDLNFHLLFLCEENLYPAFLLSKVLEATYNSEWL